MYTFKLHCMPDSSERSMCVHIGSIMKNSCFSGIENEYVKSASLHNTQYTTHAYTDGMILIVRIEHTLQGSSILNQLLYLGVWVFMCPLPSIHYQFNVRIWIISFWTTLLPINHFVRFWSLNMFTVFRSICIYIRISTNQKPDDEQFIKDGQYSIITS